MLDLVGEKRRGDGKTETLHESGIEGAGLPKPSLQESTDWAAVK